MRVGIVCPYSFDAPGGVQAHVTDLAAELEHRGHTSSVLAPAAAGTELPPRVTGCGGAVAVPYNGSVARLTFTPASRARVRAWLDDGAFDVLHVHEPATPSISRQAALAARVPVVATFHASLGAARLPRLARPLLAPVLGRLDERIAVSAQALASMRAYDPGAHATVIPNGVDVARFARAAAREEWRGTAAAPTLAFLGRLDEPRKGLDVLVRAYLRLLDTVPGARLLIAGRGDATRARRLLARHPARPDRTGAVTFLGPVDESAKESLLASVDVYVAPQTGGESFGIVLVEAMAAGTAVVASDVPAFRAVLEDGALGRHAAAGDPQDLARTLVEALTRGDDGRRARATRAVARYDWGRVTDEIEEVLARARDRGRAV